MNHRDFLGDAFDFEKGELNHDKAIKKAFADKAFVNILLIGATGVGKSSLINAVFGDDVAKVGEGKPVTQHLQKFEIIQKGLTLWDTKGIEAADYENTIEQLKKEIEDAFNNDDPKHYPHIAWLCIKESSKRVEDRELELLSIVKALGIPTVVVFTDTKFEDGDVFFTNAQQEIDEKYSDFIQSRYVRVNSKEYSIAGNKIPKTGLDDLISMTEKCFPSADINAKKRLAAFHKAQEVNNKKRLDAMLDEAKTVVHWAAAAAGAAGATPIPASDAPIIAGIQSTMIYKINAEFELSMDQSTATSTIAGIMGITALAQVGKTIVANALKFIPGAGSFIGGAISAATAVALTEAVGFAYISVLEHFFNLKTGKVELPVDTEMLLSVFKTFFKK